MKKSPKIVKLDIDEDDQFSGVDAISLVESPAIELNWTMFSNQNFESYSDYPDAVSNNAKRGIELNEKVDNKCATQVGKVRAQQLAKGEAISVETIKRMYSYLSRAEEYYDESDTSACGTISYLLWGGLAGKRWAESKLKELDLFEGALEVGELPEYVDEPSGSLIVKLVENAGGFSVGDYVSWTFAGRGEDSDRGRGQIVDLRIQGEVQVPETDVTLTATEEEPVALIRTRSGKVVGQYTRNLRQIQKPDGFVKPSAGESEDEFISRCIPVVIGEGKDQDQASAICYSYWEERFEEKTEEYMTQLFDFLGYIDELPVYSTPEEAMEVSKIAGCEGYHEHQIGELTVYMPCESHEESWDSLLKELYESWMNSKKKSWNDLSEDDKDNLLAYLDKVAVDAPTSKEEFNDVKTSSIKASGRNYGESFMDTPTTKIRYMYDGPVDSKNRDFCRILMTRYTNRGKVFRKEDINNMSFAGVNTGFGPNGINEYNIFLYRGGNNCRHTWKTVTYSRENGKWDDSTKTVESIAELQKIIAPRNPQTTLEGTTIGPLAIGTSFSKQEFKDQQIVAGPFMIPNKLIYRNDENGEYYVYFSDETIKKIAYKYMQNKYTDSTNLEHVSELALDDVFVVESWLVEDPKRDKSLIYSGGEEYPKGTWYGLMKVKNKGVWDNYVKSGLVKGFSVEGFFIDELLNKTKV